MSDGDGPFSRPRTISSGWDVPRVNRTDGIQLVATAAADPARLRAAGATQARSGWWIARSGADFPFEELEPFLPRYARRTVVPYVVDLIPSTAWHASLANVLMKSDWDVLRARTEAEAGGCHECGIKSGIECHERWTYDTRTLVQRLTGLEALCQACHETRHLGFANVRGRLEPVFDRLCTANRLEASERAPYLKLVFDLFGWRSAREWDLDVSVLSGGGLRLKKALTHLGEGRIAGRIGDRAVDFTLVETDFEVGPKGILIV